MKKGEGKQYNFEETREEIRPVLKCGDLHMGLQMLNMLHDQMIMNNDNIKSHHWYIYFNTGYCFKKLEMYEKSLEVLNKSLIYTCNNDDIKYFKSMWMMANIYSILDNKKYAKRTYNKLVEYCKENNNTTDRIIMLLNIAYIDNNIKRMCCITKCFANLSDSELIQGHIDTEKIVSEITRMVYEVADNNSFYLQKILHLLKRTEKQLDRKNLFAQMS